MRDANILTPSDIKARDEAQEARDFRILAGLLCLMLSALFSVFAYALWSVQP